MSRLHVAGATRPVPGRDFVLYWMQSTQRAHDNFALDFAVERADDLGLPVLVHHELRHDDPWASDRFHRFALEGVIDLVAAFAARGIQYAFHLDRGADDVSPLPALARRAALVVTDWYPAYTIPRRTRELRRAVDCPVIAVDSATVVPARHFDKAYSAARHMRPALMRELDHWLHRTEPLDPAVRRAVALPFDPTVPTPATLSSLIAGCDIDHGVPPAPGWTGGTEAARRRLDWWTVHGLPHYLERDDPNRDVTSRMSPWLRYGHVSPHEVLLAARETGHGAAWEKFVDELLVWRELAFNLCAHDPKHRTVAAIPEWARRELADHENDPRELYDDDTLDLGETHDDLWNAAQRAYRRDGWMHNYVRMLWGKSVIGWTENAARALRVLEHLNNRYALDGRDPNSYAGILWCFGKFDRPFYRRPIFGTVRYMSLRAATKKFDAKRYIAAH